jgi:hypothetical protein
MSTTSFNFVPRAYRPPKPRTVGLTEIRGLPVPTIRYLAHRMAGTGAEPFRPACQWLVQDHRIRQLGNGQKDRGAVVLT